MCAKFGSGPMVVSKKRGRVQTHTYRQTKGRCRGGRGGEGGGRGREGRGVRERGGRVGREGGGRVGEGRREGTMTHNAL